MNVKLMKSVGFFFMFVFGISVVIGIYYASNIDSSLFFENDFSEYSFTSFSDYLIENIFLFTSFVLSFVGVGLIGLIFYLIFKLVSFTFLSYILASVFKFNGFLVITMYVVIYSLIFLCLYSLFIQLIKININSYYYLFDKNKYNINVLIKAFKKSIVIYIFLAIYSTLLLLCDTFITEVVFFLLKL